MQAMPAVSRDILTLKNTRRKLNMNTSKKVRFLALGAVICSCLYRLFVAVALRLNVPAECMKLVSALIVAVAIASPALKRYAAFQKQKAARRGGAKC